MVTVSCLQFIWGMMEEVSFNETIVDNFRDESAFYIKLFIISGVNYPLSWKDRRTFVIQSPKAISYLNQSFKLVELDKYALKYGLFVCDFDEIFQALELMKIYCNDRSYIVLSKEPSACMVDYEKALTITDKECSLDFNVVLNEFIPRGDKILTFNWGSQDSTLTVYQQMDGVLPRLPLVPIDLG